MSIISGAVNSLTWLRGWNLMSLGGWAIYRNGPLIVSRSWVPMATRDRFRAMFWCSLSCRSMKLSYLKMETLQVRMHRITFLTCHHVVPDLIEFDAAKNGGDAVRSDLLGGGVDDHLLPGSFHRRK